MSAEPRVLRHGTDTPDVARPPFRVTCPCGRMYTAGLGTPDPGIYGTWVASHSKCEGLDPDVFWTKREVERDYSGERGQ